MATGGFSDDEEEEEYVEEEAEELEEVYGGGDTETAYLVEVIGVWNKDVQIMVMERKMEQVRLWILGINRWRTF